MTLPHLLEWLKWKLLNMPSADQAAEWLNLSCKSGGLKTGTATVEEWLADSYKVKYTLTKALHSLVFPKEIWKFICL